MKQLENPSYQALVAIVVAAIVIVFAAVIAWNMPHASAQQAVDPTVAAAAEEMKESGWDTLLSILPWLLCALPVAIAAIGLSLTKRELKR